MKKIFLATPIAGYNDEKRMLEYKNQIALLIHKLKEKFHIYAQIATIRNINDYDTPAESAMIDFKQIEESEIFVFHYPSKIPTSALIELGYAFGKAKKIIIIVPDRETLPYMAQEFDYVYKNAKILICKEMSEEAIQTLFEEICAVADCK